MSSTNFKKHGPRSALAIFEAEADGLAELKKAGAVRVPEVYDVSADADGAYIEFELQRRNGRKFLFVCGRDNANSRSNMSDRQDGAAKYRPIVSTWNRAIIPETCRWWGCF